MVIMCEIKIIINRVVQKSNGNRHTDVVSRTVDSNLTCWLESQETAGTDGCH